MELAIGLWRPDIRDAVLAPIFESGVRAVELSDAAIVTHDRTTLAGAADTWRARGVRVWSVHAPFGGEHALALLDESARRQAVATHVDALSKASAIGASCVVIHPGDAVVEAEPDVYRSQLYKSLDALIPVAESEDVRLALENLPPGWLGESGAAVRRVVDDFDVPILGVCFDTGHANLDDDGLVASYRAVRDRVITFHLHDNDGQKDRHVQPGYGTADWEGFARELAASDFADPVVLESRPWARASWRTMLREMEALLTVGRLRVPLDGSRVRPTCDTCGRLCFGTPEKWFCGCVGQESVISNQ
jgi:sugar phosphate isomerase/epimerase